MSRIFLTGGTGVLGRRAVPALVRAGHEVTALSRSDPRSDQLRRHGATPVTIDLLDRGAVRSVLAGHDVVAHLATSIPTGASMLAKRGWRTNDRLRRDASAVLADAAIEVGIDRFVQESITFPYVDGGDAWIDESQPRTYFWGDRSTVDAEAASERITAAGGAGVVLRFAMFAAPDSAHLETVAAMARRGRWSLLGHDDAITSLIHVDDAASAVVAAIGAPAGTYNVAEPDPKPRSAHRRALADAVGRDSLGSLPRLVERLGGDSADSISRSHRISSNALRDATAWQPLRSGVDIWKELS